MIAAVPSNWHRLCEDCMSCIQRFHKVTMVAQLLMHASIADDAVDELDAQFKRASNEALAAFG